MYRNFAYIFKLFTVTVDIHYINSLIFLYGFLFLLLLFILLETIFYFYFNHVYYNKISQLGKNQLILFNSITTPK